MASPPPFKNPLKASKKGGCRNLGRVSLGIVSLDRMSKGGLVQVRRVAGQNSMTVFGQGRPSTSPHGCACSVSWNSDRRLSTGSDAPAGAALAANWRADAPLKERTGMRQRGSES
ncbi:hypothetical protein BN2364_2551 [Alloalcanivorax xenomutans]|nr:hypothetical protein BN2364_2551 [Alloalcanivorax xenomutans]